ncbi:Coiled-coil domain-containing protein 42 homolog [Coccomyxa sp. Obi]|nr:Coiled-coil domain-containing protein 42 homolog [Coccomyxa sp. Obi]
MESIQFMQLVPRERPASTSFLPSHVSPATRLLEKRRETFEIQEALEKQKQQFARKEEEFRAREDSLKRRDLELQDSMIRFSKFLQDNEAKRVRAVKKVTDEKKMRESKEREIEEVQSSLEQVKTLTEKTREALQRFIRYEDYLENVLDSTEEFHEIGEIMLRHATLQATNIDLMEQQQRVTDLAEHNRAELQGICKTKTANVLALRNKLQGLRREMDLVSQEILALENGKDAVMNAATQKTLEHGQLCMTIENLYHRVQSCSSVKHSSNIGLLAQAEVVCNFICDMASMKVPRNVTTEETPNAVQISV